MASRTVEDIESAFNAWAWQRWEEVRQHGTITVEDGTVYRAGMRGFRELINVLQYHCSRKPPRVRWVPEPSDYVAQSTTRAREGSPGPPLVDAPR